MLTNLMIEQAGDRRRRPRLRLFCSLRLQRLGRAHTVATRTEDVSCQGFYFTSEHPFEPHERLECELVIQGEQLGSHSEIDVVLRGTAEVVRVVPKRLRQGFGVACRLVDYTVERVTPAGSIQQGILVEI